MLVSWVWGTGPTPHVQVDGEAVTGVSDAGTFVLSETALNMHCWGENPVVTAKLQLNGHDRFAERDDDWLGPDDEDERRDGGLRLHCRDERCVLWVKRVHLPPA